MGSGVEGGRAELSVTSHAVNGGTGPGRLLLRIGPALRPGPCNSRHWSDRQSESSTGYSIPQT
jgi:hypothetical protein